MTKQCNSVNILIYVMRTFVPKKYTYKGVSKSFRTDRLQRELQMLQPSATKCSCIAIFWVSIVSFAAITFLLLLNECLFLLLFISLSTQSGNFWIHPCVYWHGVILLDQHNYAWTVKIWQKTCRLTLYVIQMVKINNENQLTPWNIGALGKFIVTQPEKRFPLFCGIRG
jgi:hypothetical protein